MKLFLDSCNPHEIREIAQLGDVLGGLTMNPSMVAAIKRDFIANMKEICSIVTVPVFAQVVASYEEEILNEGKALAAIDDKIVVKVHTTVEGLKGIQRLKAEGIKTCATGIHSVIEALLAAKAGADHAAIFVGPLGEVENNPTERLIATIRNIYDRHEIPTLILGCCRNMNEVVESFACGAHETTTVYENWKAFLSNDWTLRRWESFNQSWVQSYGDRNWITGY